MPRAAIYARYSTDLQNDKSIDDQVALCRAYAERNGLDVIAVYSDRAASGASLHGRTGMIELLGAARARAFDVVIAETLSRIGRDEEDRAAIRKRLTFADIKVMTPADGVVTRLVDGVKAVIDSQYLEDLKSQIRRGLAGVVRAGRHAGGRAYGYRPIRRLDANGELVRGELEIVPGEAEVVRRIYAEYAAGKSPRKIAAELNADHIAAPRGAYWRAATIAGNLGRGHSMIGNELYAGMVVWNRVRMIRDPDSGRRVSRVNPKDQWHRAPAEHLRIVSDDLWNRVQDRRRERSAAPFDKRQAPRRMLSGLLRCGACGAGMSLSGHDRKGSRIVCSAHKEGGDAACAHGRYYYIADIEERIIVILRRHLGTKDAIALYVRTYNEERRKLATNENATRDKLERGLDEATRAVDRTIENLVRGRISDAEADRLLPGLRAERDRLAAQLASLGQRTKSVTLHPAAIDAYLRELDRLAEVLTDHSISGRTEAIEPIRRMIETVTVMPTPAKTAPELRIAGSLASLINEAPFADRSVADERVAGERSDLPRRQILFNLVDGPGSHASVKNTDINQRIV